MSFDDKCSRGSEGYSPRTKESKVNCHARDCKAMIASNDSNWCKMCNHWFCKKHHKRDGYYHRHTCPHNTLYRPGYDRVWVCATCKKKLRFPNE